MRLALLAVAALIASACQPATLPTGATLSYVRSNSDGTLPEHIHVHIASPTEVHVAKMVSPCTDAAYVTATFNASTGEATRLVGGRLQKDGTQLPQAWLTLTPNRKLEVRLGDPNGAPAETHDAPPAPWRMYDFDLAEFALFGPRKPKDFTFGLVLAWPDGSSPLVRTLGQAQAKFTAGEGYDDQQQFRRFEIAGAVSGTMMFEERYGYLATADFATPNHPGYKDFRLTLETAAIENGENAWRQAIAAHWQGC